MIAIERPLKIELPSWSGPLDLLLDLIKKNKIDIYDIPIAFLTGEYLKSIAAMSEIELDISSDFLVMASRLVYIKSRTLLPDAKEELDESEDPRKELVHELLEYQRFKALAEIFEETQGEKDYSVFRKEKMEPFIPSVKKEALWKNVGLPELVQALYSIVDQLDRKLPDLSALRDEAHSIEEKMDFIQKSLEIEKELRFRALFNEKTIAKEEAIITLLAILELYKQGLILFKQESLFSEIYLFKKEVKIAVSSQNTKKPHV